MLVDCISNGKQISVALLNYESAIGSLPPAHLVDGRNARLHSWRTLLLPFMEEREIYGRIDLTQPWHSQANLFLSKIPLWTMHCPVDPSDAYYTSYLAVVGPSTAFPGTHPVRLKEITDGTTNTIMAVEQSRSGVLWAEPRDLSSETMVGDIRSEHSRGRVANFGDGHVKVISHDVDPAVLRALTTATGREPIADTEVQIAPTIMRSSHPLNLLKSHDDLRASSPHGITVVSRGFWPREVACSTRLNR